MGIGCVEILGVVEKLLNRDGCLVLSRAYGIIAMHECVAEFRLICTLGDSWKRKRKAQVMHGYSYKMNALHNKPYL
jgi:hypothetical protein